MTDKIWAARTLRVVTYDVLQPGELAVGKSVLEAIQAGDWSFEPDGVPEDNYSATSALPGSAEKLEILARRIRDGLPLWHPEDRHTYEDGLTE